MTPELGMQNTAIKEKPEECQRKIQQERLTWTDNPDVQKLLDVVVSILAEEYIEVARRNPDVFSSGAETTPNIQEDGSGKSDPYIKSGSPDQVGE